MALYNRGSFLEIGKKLMWCQFLNKGSHTGPSNYRPISLTCICCKVFEHIIVPSISQHTNCLNLICKEQHGFRKNHLCEMQLIEIVNDLSHSLNSARQTDLLHLDLSKAFNNVSHSHLLYKQSYYGITGNLPNWINDFFKGRVQQVLLQNDKSKYFVMLYQECHRVLC